MSVCTAAHALPRTFPHTS